MHCHTPTTLLQTGTYVWMQLSKLMEEEQVKRDRDAEFRDLRQVAHERQAQVNAFKHELMGAGSLSASLQQELQFAR